MEMELECMEDIDFLPGPTNIEQVGHSLEVAIFDNEEEDIPDQIREASMVDPLMQGSSALSNNGFDPLCCQGAAAVSLPGPGVDLSAAMAGPLMHLPLPHVVNPMVYKLCPDCNVVKPASDYHARKKASLGLAVYCKPCSSARSKVRNRKLAEQTLARGGGEAVAAVDRKMCACCLVEKPAIDFHLKSQSLTGLESYCRLCHAMKMREYRLKYKQRNQEAHELPQDFRKACSRCGEEKPATDFHRHSAQVSGLDCYCKPCAADRARDKRRKAAEASGRRFVSLLERRSQEEKERSRSENRTEVNERRKGTDATEAKERTQEPADREAKQIRRRQKGDQAKLDENGYKICPDCQVGKPPSEYHLRTKAALGLAVYCKPCSAERSAQRRRRAIEENVRNGIPPPRSRAPRLHRERLRGPVESKECRDCCEVKAAVEFNKNKKNWTGLSSYCKPCYRLRVKRSHEKHRAQSQTPPLATELERSAETGRAAESSALGTGNTITDGGGEGHPSFLQAAGEQRRVSDEAGQALEQGLLCLEEAGVFASELYDMEDEEVSVGEGLEGEGELPLEVREDPAEAGGAFVAFRREELVMLGNLEAVERQMAANGVNHMGAYAHAGLYQLMNEGMRGGQGGGPRFEEPRE